MAIFFIMIVLTYALDRIGVPYYLIFITLLPVSFLLTVLEKKGNERLLSDVIRAKLIEETAVYKTKTRNSGFSLGRSFKDFRNYYTYEEVIDHYDCTFKVVYKDLTEGMLKCKKESSEYYTLMSKA